ncbi:cation/H(+) antiporter [Streptomyces sp. M1013]|uniref:cation:proton antiporter n=1 Tax=Streptomyces sp. M1013 TaxID=549798 RepID=UPI000978EDC9|nr:cation:proton antiporter [Streptomyces sp. M1013]OMI89478.1 cation/H(+) antiporter [Streptomyces sp. M1013]
MSELSAAGASQAAAGSLLAALALVLAAAALASRLARWARQPAVVGEIIAGIALGPSLLGLLPGDLVGLLFPADVRLALEVLAHLGLVLFMFGVGYQFDAGHLRGHGRQVVATSLASLTLPFALGAGLAWLLRPWFVTAEMSTSGLLVPALFLGAAMSITAFPVLARIIVERGLRRQRVGAVAVACAAIQDVLAWGVLAVVVALANSTGPWPVARMVLVSGVFVLGLLTLARPGLKWLLAPERRWSGGPVNHAVLLVGLLLSAWATEAIGLHAVFGAFAFGAVVPRRSVDAATPEVPERIEQTSLLLLPVFFVVTGLSVDVTGLGGRGLLILLAVLAVACAGKFAGAAGAALLTGATRREAATLGVLLNTRGLTELIILNVGLALGALDSRMFTALVIMAVVTTVMAGPLLGLLDRAGGDRGRSAVSSRVPGSPPGAGTDSHHGGGRPRPAEPFSVTPGHSALPAHSVENERS